MVADTNTSYDTGSSLLITTHWRARIFMNIAETLKRNGRKLEHQFLIHN
jgi:hypothetical protein